MHKNFEQFLAYIKRDYEFTISNDRYTASYYGPYDRLPEKDLKWIAQAPPGRERVVEYSNKLKRNVRIERVKK